MDEEEEKEDSLFIGELAIACCMLSIDVEYILLGIQGREGQPEQLDYLKPTYLQSCLVQRKLCLREVLSLSSPMGIEWAFFRASRIKKYSFFATETSLRWEIHLDKIHMAKTQVLQLLL